MEYEVLEENEKCRCGGEIDRVYLVSSNPNIWRGQCFICGKPYIVVCLHRCDDHKEVSKCRR